MIGNFILKHCAKGNAELKSNEVRTKVGNISSLIGIGINIVLCTSKIAIGSLFGSVSISADGINNLSDAGNSIISLVSFKLSSRPADKEHPFGHARYEYIAAMIVAVSILVLGVEMIKSSLDKIINPQPVHFSWLAVGVLVFSILAKGWLYFFNSGVGKAIDSSVMQATAADSLSDSIATTVVLVSLFVSTFFNIQLDGYMGIIVAGFIMFTAFNILKETLDNLLGTVPELDFVKHIEDKVKSYPGILGIHDLMIHNYGPNRCFASVHAEVASNVDILKSHDLIDNIERDFLNEDNIHLVIHLDPIVVDNPQIKELYDFMKQSVHEIDPELQIHDFRAVLGESHSNLIFDLVIPYSCKLTQSDIQEQINAKLATRVEKLYTVITFERPFN